MPIDPIDQPKSGADPHGPRSTENPGYETTDVNVGGVIVFLAGLAGFLAVFFVFCFVMGRVINNAFEKQDGPLTKWKREAVGPAGGAVQADTGLRNKKREDLASNPEMEQKDLQRMTANFPTPRLDIDDGNQATADLHAREDLLLDHYSAIDPAAGGQAGAIRIPISRAMELIAQRGLPVAAGPGPVTRLAEDVKPVVQVPLTSGFARTGYELDTMEARAQKMSYGKAEGAAHAELQSKK